MSHKRLFSILFIFSFVLTLVALSTVNANDEPGDGIAVAQAPESEATIAFEGQITAINANNIVVNGLTVVVDDSVLASGIFIGNTISVSGILQPDGTIVASIVVVINHDDDDDDDDGMITPVATEEVTPATTEEPSATPIPDADDDDGDDDDDRPIIVIYGPVVAININVVTIYNIDIEFEDNDPALTVIQIGDVIRVEGEFDDDRHNDDDDDDDDDNNNGHNMIGGNRIVIVNVVNITFISVTVIIIDGQIWRDPGDCSGLPEWIEDDDAVEYLVRCSGGGNPGGGGNSGGGGNNNSDDDDDNGGGRRNNRNNNSDDDDD